MLGKEGEAQPALTLALVGAVGSGRLPGELVVARAAAIAGATTGVVLAVTLQPAGTERGTDRVGVMTGMYGMGSCCVTLLCITVTDLVRERVVFANPNVLGKRLRRLLFQLFN